MRGARVAMVDPADAPPVVVGNSWHHLVLAPDATPPHVSVVIPVRDGQVELDRLLASLERQDHPGDRLEVIVVDDASSPPLVVPDGVRLLQQDASASFGAGRARNAGAAMASGDVLLFLDADVVVGPTAVSRLARWWAADPASVVTAVLGFFDVEAVGAAVVDTAVAAGRLAELVAPVEWNDQAWRDPHFARTDDMTVEDPEIFSVTVGAVMCVPRRLHEQVGGLRELGRRGIEDTEYGYRLHTAGALMVLDRTVEIWHQGRRFFSSGGGAEAKEGLRELNNELMASPRYRVDTTSPRQVPVAVVEIDPGVAVENLPSNRRADVLVLGEVDGRPLAEIDACGVPFRIRVERSCRIAPTSFEAMIDHMREHRVGVAVVEDEAGSAVMTITSLRAEGRARLGGLAGAAMTTHVERAFGRSVMTAAAVGVTTRV
jgi:GT2 family glycosyltransferase